jgi:N-methylhydantoinase A
MRYVGQEHAVTIELPPTLLRKQDRVGVKERFDAEHQLRYGTCAPREAAEIVSLRVTVSGVMKKPPLEEITRGTRNPPVAASTGMRPVHYDGRKASMRTPVYARDMLRAGNKIAGPALVEEHASTTVVFPGDALTVDRFGNLVRTCALSPVPCSSTLARWRTPQKQHGPAMTVKRPVRLLGRHQKAGHPWHRAETRG